MCQPCLKDFFTPWSPFLTRKEGLWSLIEHSQNPGGQVKLLQTDCRQSSLHAQGTECFNPMCVLRSKWDQWYQSYTTELLCLHHQPDLSQLDLWELQWGRSEGFCYSCCKWHQVSETWGFRTILIPLQLGTPRWASPQSTELFSIIFHKKRECCFQCWWQRWAQRDSKTWNTVIQDKIQNSTYGIGRFCSVPSVPAEKGHKGKTKHYGNSSTMSGSSISLSFAILKRHRMNSNTIPLRSWSMSKIAPKWMEKKSKGAHQPHNSPMEYYQQIKKSDTFSDRKSVV